MSESLFEVLFLYYGDIFKGTSVDGRHFSIFNAKTTFRQAILCKYYMLWP